MAPTACFSFLPTCLCIGFLLLLLLGHGSPASTKSCEAEFEKLQALEPIPQELRSEVGTVKYFEASQQLGCVGAFVILVEIDREGLTVPRYIDNAGLAYALKGRGIVGFAFPGCPETYYHFKQGDVIALPPGVTFWFYNDGDTPLELIYFFHGNNFDNDPERNVKFSSEPRPPMLESWLRPWTRSLQGQDIQAINIVPAPGGVTREVHPSLNDHNSTCRMKLTMNLEDPDIKDPQRRITFLTGHKFHILNSLQLSVERGTLIQDATVSPLYTIKAQSVVYMIRGSARLQIVDNRGVAVFDAELLQGQLLVLPEYFILLAKAGKDGFEYIVFKTDANPVLSQIAGPGSVLRGLPVGVIAASYNVSTQDAMKIKNSRGYQ